MVGGRAGQRGGHTGEGASARRVATHTVGKRGKVEAPQDVASVLADVAATRAIFAALPNSDARRAAARFLAAGIREADAVAPGSWVTTVREGFVRLNVGQVAVMTILPEEISFAVASRPRALPFGGGMTRAPWGPGAAFMSAARDCEIVCAEPETLAASLPRWQAPFLAFVRAAAAAKRGSPFRRAFREGVLRYLEAELAAPLPQGLAAGAPRASVRGDARKQPTATARPRPHALFGGCVYTIVAPGRFWSARASGVPLEEGKPWSTAQKMLAQATAESLEVPVLFADARDVSRLLFWARLERLEIEGRRTRYFVGAPRAFRGTHAPHELELLDGKKLSPGFIRNYVLCRTPSFLGDREIVPSPAEMREAEASAVEGEIRYGTREHRSRESRLRAEKIASVLTRGEALRCEVPGCGFDFGATYGELGHGFAVVHHLDPIGDGGVRRTRLEDLAVVCANCHAMVHLGGATRALQEVGRALGRGRGGRPKR